ncbi:MAG TPA: aquaporin, partial [Candidatus Acidoferrales bacterium]|nr:aquaporin [Candidatus Acidoferrales bacterium]
GASMNPARSIGPQIVAGMTSYSWIYALGPLLGATAAAALGYLIFGEPKLSELEAAHGKHT